jgi:hypothetical protein
MGRAKYVEEEYKALPTYLSRQSAGLELAPYFAM